MDAKFFSSLFEGDCANGFKLGMGLTGGDFWPRPAGGQDLYRYNADGPIGFEDILAVFNTDQTVITVPETAEHEPDCAYVYVLRRVNCCGQEVQSLDAAVKVEFDSDGQLQSLICNDVFNLWAQQLEGSKVELTWYYCPIAQTDTCSGYMVYSDNGSGEIDYENELCRIDYAGPGLYRYKSQILDKDKYIFCVRSVSAGGLDVLSANIFEVQLSRLAPATAGIVQSQIV